MGSPRHRRARTGTVARLRTTLCTAALGIAGLVGAAVIATPADAIVGGSTVSNGKYPFVASLQTPGGDHFCGGSVISSYWVLTAAHCVAGAKPRDQVVVVGRTSLIDTEHGQRLGVSLIRVHPRYDGQTYDVALLKLSRSTWVRGIPLARSADNRRTAPSS
jgi:trypsin